MKEFYEPMLYLSTPEHPNTMGVLVTLEERNDFNGFVPVEDADYHLKIVSPTGTMMSVGDSITGLGDEAVFIITSGNCCQNTLLSGGFFNGCMMTLYDSDGSAFGNVYVSVSGDRTIRNVFFTDQTKTTNDAMLENLDQAELVNTDNNKTYIHPSSFNIEGKWKNNGEYTFGQVQAESIISFDGEHCNVYSPQDTYAFYKDGDDFRLSCTSFLFSDTVSFTVKIVDENNIDLVDGSDILELTRVE